MKKEEAIQRIHDHKIIHHLKEPRAIKISEALDMAIDALQFQDIYNEKWTPCSKRLPDKNGIYIVSLEDTIYPWATFHNGKWFMLSVGHIARAFDEYEVFAWQPLPKLYERSNK